MESIFTLLRIYICFFLCRSSLASVALKKQYTLQNYNNIVQQFGNFRIFLEKEWKSLRFNAWSCATIFVSCFAILSLSLHFDRALIPSPEVVYDIRNVVDSKYEFPSNDEDLILYAPNVSLANTLMENVRQELQIKYAALMRFDNRSHMQWVMEHACCGNSFAVDFENLPENADRSILRYSISSTAGKISTKKRYVNDEQIAGVKDGDQYISSGLLLLQYLIDKSYISSRKIGNSYNYGTDIASMPTLAQNDTKSKRLIRFGSLYAILLNVLLLSTFLVPIVEEKQNGIKNFLYIATSNSFLNAVSFFLIRFVLYAIFTGVVLTAAMQFNALGECVPLTYIFILFTLYMLSAMSYTYLISVCFHSVFHAKVGGLLLLTMPYVLYFSKGLISSVANIFGTKTFMEGLKVFQTFTNKYHNISSSELTINITEGSFSVLSIYGILVAQCGVYCLLYNYLSSIFPGPGSLKKPYLFPFTALWRKNKQRNEYTTCERGNDAIIIQDLKKSFKKPVRVISDRLNMAIKNKQITVLLGHNGAGKTTTLNMIMGSEPKDSGKITVCSERDVASYRHLIGFCPQHSVFMPYMTCVQHLKFFAELRGMSPKEADSLASTLLTQLRLVDKAHEYGRNLSGGMKRRLSLGIAITGNTKVVVLDEPSSGLDIESRRELWDILLELRKTKAVLITTHHMEEAEVLGDTICILANGRLQCTGSPLELKHKLGRGYILKLCTSGDNFDNEETLEQIRRYVTNAEVLNVVKPTVHICLPYGNKSEYSKMLRHLEEHQEELSIKSISISDVSMEDVFLNCVPELDEVDSVNTNSLTVSRVPYQRMNPQTSWGQQVEAIFYKKLIFLKNEWKFFAAMIALPMLSVVLAVTLMYSMSVVGTEDKLRLDLQHVKTGVIYMKTSGANHGVSAILKQQIEKYDGIKVKELNVTEGESVAKVLLNLQSEDLAYFLQNVIGVIEVSSSETEGLQFNIHFSGNIYHSSVILLNIVDNAVLQWKTNEASGIETTYIPIRRHITDVSPTRLEYYAVIVPIGMFFCIFFYVLLPFNENESGFKKLQAVPRTAFWLSTFAFDAMLHLLVCLLVFGLQWVIMPREFYSLAEQCLIMWSIFFYGVSYLPILYSFANVFRSISTISTYLLFMLIVSAIIPLITSGSVRAMEYHESTILFLSLLPDFNLNHQLRIINEEFLFVRRNPSSFASNMPSVLSTSNFFLNGLLTLAISMVVLVYILENKYKCHALVEFFNCYNCRQLKLKSSPVVEEAEESPMRQEKITVDAVLREKMEGDYPLLVSDLYKFYNRKVAVCGLNFAVRRQECFGLLGVNGAGKTSTFQMIAANNTISGGTIKIDGVDIVQQETQYRYRFGYCPQNDCLLHFMTAYQQLAYMAKLRGIVEPSDVYNEVMYWLDKLDLLKYQNVQIHYYSGGTKRKLNAALAMIGSPSLVLLDEPTTGVDPASRRFLWKCIKEFQSQGKTVVLTSHSMDECEQLCNRLAIMTDGKFKCLGFVPDLKKRFGSGFTIKAKIRDDETDKVVYYITDELRNKFPKCELRENHAGMLTYFVQNFNHLNWSIIFRLTEDFYEKCQEFVEDYSINETTLEDIFLESCKTVGGLKGGSTS